MTTDTPPAGERADLVSSLDRQRELFRLALDGVTDDQARLRSTVSELTLGGLVKHVTAMELEWARFAADGPGPATDWSQIDWSNPPAEVIAHQESFTMREDETLAGLVAAWDAAAATVRGIATDADLDASHPLPQAPWFTPGDRWTVRRVLLHLVGEISQHAGHADVVREGIDGHRSMG